LLWSFIVFPRELFSGHRSAYGTSQFQPLFVMNWMVLITRVGRVEWSYYAIDAAGLVRISNHKRHTLVRWLPFNPETVVARIHGTRMEIFRRLLIVAIRCPENFSADREINRTIEDESFVIVPSGSIFDAAGNVCLECGSWQRRSGYLCHGGGDKQSTNNGSAAAIAGAICRRPSAVFSSTLNFDR
jgi:hypothetical protein